jgi:hypothetical protein
MTYDPNEHTVPVTYHPPMPASEAVLLTADNIEDMYHVVEPIGPVLQRPDYSTAEPGDYVVKIPDARQINGYTWVVMPAEWVTELPFPPPPPPEEDEEEPDDAAPTAPGSDPG